MSNSGCLFGPLGGIFSKKPAPAPAPEPVVPKPLPPPMPALVIPYPEEPVNPAQTAANTPPSLIVNQWLTRYNVPKASWDFWLTQIDIHVYDFWPDDLLVRFHGINKDTPAFTYADTVRHLYVLASWLNAGVVAHEQAHNSYSLLSQAEKDTFSAVYNQVKQTDSLILLLYSKNTYGLTSDIEGHAELYRYLNEKMPDSLKKFYPKLIETG